MVGVRVLRSAVVWVAVVGCHGADAPREAPFVQAETLRGKAVQAQPEGQERVAPRVALRDGGQGLLVRGGRLFWLRDGRWAAAPLDGATAVDVVAARGALWALCRGTGTLAGHVMVLRYEAPDRLVLVDSGAVADGFVPQALAVEREAFPLGGNGPPLVRLQRGALSTLVAAGPPVETLRWSPDEVLLLGHPGQGPSAWRWGEHHATLRPSTRWLLAGLRGTFGVLDDGSVVRGLPWSPLARADRVAPAWPGATEGMVAATVDAQGRVVLASARGTVGRTPGRRWEAVPALPEAPAALLGTGDGLAAVTAVFHDGRCLALTPEGWVEQIAASPP